MTGALKTTDSTSGAWYTLDGKDNDVVLSTRVRLARNLADFAFPSNMKDEDFDQVQAIVFDAFNHMEDADSYQSVNVNRLDRLGSRILQERHIFSEEESSKGGVVIRNDGRLCCTVNMTDHVRISSFVPGFDFQEAYDLVHSVDASLQKNIQFAASYDFGFLTKKVKDSGSGMKLSVQLHLPCLTLQGKIRIIAENLKKKGLALTSCFGAGEGSAALGFYYQISNAGSQNGSEEGQMSLIEEEVREVIGMEREERKAAFKTIPTFIRNMLFRSIAIANNSLFVTLREAIDIVSSIKLGLDLHLIDGISDSSLAALLYRIQDAHLEFVMNKGVFNFEKDIASNPNKKNERLRALLLQEAFEHVQVAL